jgi:hypothetical protein
VLNDFDWKVDLRAYLRVVLPLWPAARRDRSCVLFGEGFTYDTSGPLAEALSPPRLHPLWMQVGRALRAAVLIQQSSQRPFAQLGIEPSYADAQAMSKALERAFGVSGRQIRGTAGWEGFIWRFLAGLGRGRRMRWYA